jgi:hypothetical protein
MGGVLAARGTRDDVPVRELGWSQPGAACRGVIPGSRAPEEQRFLSALDLGFQRRTNR